MRIAVGRPRGDKPFPAPIRWLGLWRNRWILLNLLNQIAHGSLEDAVGVTDIYGGDSSVGLEVWVAARESIAIIERRVDA